MRGRLRYDGGSSNWHERQSQSVRLAVVGKTPLIRASPTFSPRGEGNGLSPTPSFGSCGAWFGFPFSPRGEKGNVTYPRQNLGSSNTSTVNSSKRPSNIAKDRIHFAASLSVV